MSLRIAILETDDVRPELVDAFHSYGRMFQELFAQQPIVATFTVFNVVAGIYPQKPEQYDAYLVTGSKCDSFATDPWIEQLKKFLRQQYEAGRALLGVCFGHQLLAIVLGGHTERATQGWGVGMQHYQIKTSASWMTPALGDLRLLAFHQDQVTRLPANATLLAGNAFCPYAAYAIGHQVLCFQGHPEFTLPFSKAISELRRSMLGEAVYQKALASLSQDPQGVLVAEWMMRFVAAHRDQSA